MHTIGLLEAEMNLSDLIERVSLGEEFTITRQGEPVARLVPAQQTTREDIQKAISEIERRSKDCCLGGLSIQELIHEGHKY